jgi:phosphatidylglycerophosphatase A
MNALPAAGTRRFDLATAVATVGGLGFSPVVPATVTSFAVSLVLLWIGAEPTGVRHLVVGVILIGVCLVAVWSGTRVERRYGHDARCIVIDEAAGMLLSAFLVPWDLMHLGVAFVLFRAADVLKPPPAYQLQSLPGGLGVLMDDLAAAGYTLALLAAARLLPGF